MKDKTESDKNSTKSQVASDGDKVLFHYKGTFNDGELFDDSRKGSVTTPPLKVLLGSNRLLEAFENAMIGMKEGETKNLHLDPENAFGLRRPEAYVVAPREKFPPNYKFKVGGFVEGNAQSGRTARARIESIGVSTVTLDMNHPLAGQDINYEIELVGILEKAESFPESIAKTKKDDCKGCKDKKKPKLPTREAVQKQRSALRKAATEQLAMESGPRPKRTTKTSTTIKNTPAPKKANIKRKRTSSPRTKKSTAKTTKKS